MAIDRNATLKRAEQLLRQGKLEGAIEEYVRLVEHQPGDWGATNALGDLYGRAGNPTRAVEQFTRVADYLFAEGFLPKAQAVYKKALKFQQTHEHTLRRLAEIATRQGLLADARVYRRQLADLGLTDDSEALEVVRAEMPVARPQGGEVAIHPVATLLSNGPGDAAFEDEERPVSVTLDGESDLALSEPPMSAAVTVVEDSSLEIDLSDELTELFDAVPEPPSEPAAAPPHLEAAFEELRARHVVWPEGAEANALYDRALQHLNEGAHERAMEALQGAVRSPTLRFKAGQALGRLFLRRGDVRAGIEWLECAAEAPAPTVEERSALLYELATAVEEVSDPVRALTILLELQTDFPDYRDVPVRLERLKRVLNGEPSA